MGHHSIETCHASRLVKDKEVQLAKMNSHNVSITRRSSKHRGTIRQAVVAWTPLDLQKILIHSKADESQQC